MYLSYLPDEQSERLCRMARNSLMEANERESDLAVEAAPWIGRSKLNRLLNSHRPMTADEGGRRPVAGATSRGRACICHVPGRQRGATRPTRPEVPHGVKFFERNVHLHARPARLRPR
jgi:hypothetical protein